MIFVSYSRADKEWVDAVDGALQQAGIETWVDRRELPIGLPWFDEVRDAIEVSSCVLACESTGFTASHHCAAEVTVAEQLGAGLLVVSVGAEPRTIVTQVADFLDRQPPGFDLGRQLVAQARSWDRRGRPRQGLLNRRDIRRFRRAEVPGHRERLVATFTSRSKRRLRSRTMVISAVTLAVGVSALFAYALFQLTTEDAKTSGEAAGRTARQSAGLEALDRDVYAAMSAADTFGETEAAIDATVLTEIHDARTPDDAITVPAGTIDFIADIGEVMVVRTDDGTLFQRSGQAPGAGVVASTLSPDSVASPFVSEVDSVIEPGVVVIRSDEETVRVITPSRFPEIARVSPDERMVAAGSSSGIVIYDIETGHPLTTLRGAPSPLSDIIWGRDSATVWAISGKTAVKWTVRSGSVLLDDRALKLRSVMPSPTSGDLWLVEESGLALAVDELGTIKRTLDLDIGTAFSGSISDDGRYIVASGSDGVAVLDLMSESKIVLNHLCGQSKPAIVRGEPIAYVNCADGLVRVPLQDPGQAEVLPIPEEIRRYPIAFDPTDGAILISSYREPFYRFLDGVTEPVETSGSFGCETTWMNLDVSIDGVMHPSGERTGQIVCTVTARPEGSRYRWTNGAFERETTHRSRSSVFSDDGQMILTGFADGSIVAWPSTNLTPQIVLTELSGDVLDIAQRGDTVYAVSRSGMLAAFEVPNVPSNATLSLDIRERLVRARELGLAAP